jgi:hypothetical protein
MVGIRVEKEMEGEYRGSAASSAAVGQSSMDDSAARKQRGEFNVTIGNDFQWAATSASRRFAT